jgi:hypothetical protein
MIWLNVTAIGLISAYLFSWWAIPVVALVVCWVSGKSWGSVIWQSIVAGMVITAALLAINIFPYGFERYDPLAQVVMLPSGWLMALITVLIGGILAGLGGAAGYSLRTITKKKRRR